MKHALSLLLALALTACAGVPFGTMTKFSAFDVNSLREADPEHIVIAFNVGEGMRPPKTGPAMVIAIKPKQPGDFEPVDKTLPMQLATTVPPNLGLAPAGAKRKWLVYQFSAAQATELRQVQTYFKQLETRKEKTKGGSLALGFKLESIAQADPALADSYMEMWMRLARIDGIFKVWSGKISQLAPSG